MQNVFIYHSILFYTIKIFLTNVNFDWFSKETKPIRQTSIWPTQRKNEPDDLIWGYKGEIEPVERRRQHWSVIHNLLPMVIPFYLWNQKNKMLRSENSIMLVLVVLVLTIPETRSSYKGNINSISVDREFV